MKPIHLAVIVAVLAAGALVFFALDSDDAERGGRSERTHEDTPAPDRDTPGSGGRGDADATGDGALSFTLKIVMPDGSAAGEAEVELHGRERRRVTADEKGELSVAGLHPGLYQIAARKSGAVGALDFELREIGDLGVLNLASGITVSGHVYDATGDPLPGALVEAVAAPSKKQSDMMQRAVDMLKPDAIAGRARAAEDGEYTLFLAAERAYTMRATASGYGLETEAERTLFRDVKGLDFRLFPAANITGKVINTAGAPLPGAHVLIVNMEAMMTGNARKAETTTNARGEFRLPRVSGGEAMLVARATGYATHIEQDLAAASRGITIMMERGMTLRLRTVDDIEKKPAPGVHVLAVHHSSFSTGVTNADGRLEIEHLATRASGSMREQQLWLQGGLYVPQVVDLGDKEPRDGVLDAGDIEVSRGGTVTGRVLAEGKTPIEGAVVRAIPGGGLDTMMMSTNSAKSGPDGVFELRGVPLDAKALIAVHPDYTMDKLMDLFEGEEEEAAPIFTDKSRTAEHDVHMTPAGRVSGIVTGPDAEPVAGAKVLANDEELFFGAMMGLLPPPPLSDAEGRFTFTGIRQGVTLTLIATHRDFSPSKLVKVVAGKGESAVLRLMKPALLHGRVLDDKGKPLPGVQVSGETQGQEERGPMSFVAGPGVGGVRPTVTNETGDYLLRNVPPGTFTLSFEHPQFVPAKTTVPVAAGQKEQKVKEIRLQRGLSIAGIVVDENSKPLGGIHVTASAGADTNGRENAGDVTGDDGRFSMGGFLGDVDFRVEASGTGWFDADTKTRPGTSDVRLVMKRPATMSGRVTSGGLPVKGATVTVYRRRAHSVSAEVAAGVPAEEVERMTRFSRKHLDSAQSGKDGGFVLERVPPDGTVIIETTHDGYRTHTLKDVAASTAALHIRLDPGVRIGGTVVDERNRPVLGARVRVRAGKGGSKRVKTDKQGHFEVGGLDEGPIKMRVEESGIGLIQTEWLSVQPGDRSIRIAATRGQKITGRVVDADGKAVKYIHVEAHDAEGKEVASDWVWASSGKFTLKGLPAGTYRLKISGGKIKEAFYVEAVSAGTKDLRVTVP